MAVGPLNTGRSSEELPDVRGEYIWHLAQGWIKEGITMQIKTIMLE